MVQSTDLCGWRRPSWHWQGTTSLTTKRTTKRLSRKSGCEPLDSEITGHRVCRSQARLRPVFELCADLDVGCDGGE